MSRNITVEEKFGTKLTLLQDILDKKQAALVAVLNISENMETLHLSPPSDERQKFLIEMGKEKQKQIDYVLACDEAFQSIFDGIADEFEEKSAEHAEKIGQLQFSINEVLELDTKIRAQEEKNELIANANFGQQDAEGGINPTNASYIQSKQRAANKGAH